MKGYEDRAKMLSKTQTEEQTEWLERNVFPLITGKAHIYYLIILFMQRFILQNKGRKEVRETSLLFSLDRNESQ